MMQLKYECSIRYALKKEKEAGEKRKKRKEKRVHLKGSNRQKKLVKRDDCRSGSTRSTTYTIPLSQFLEMRVPILIISWNNPPRSKLSKHTKSIYEFPCVQNILERPHVFLSSQRKEGRRKGLEIKNRKENLPRDRTGKRN